MGKRIFCILICLALLSGLVGCSKDESQQTSDSQTSSQSSENQTGNDSATDTSQKQNGTEIESVEPVAFAMFADNKLFGHTSKDYADAMLSYKSLKLELGAGFEGFCSQVNEMYDKGIDYMGLGIPYCTQFGLGFAQGSAAALRYAVELQLKDKGISVETDKRLPDDWNSIYGISYTTPVPFYMEALSIEKNDSEQAEFLRTQGGLNYLAEEMIPDVTLIQNADEISLKTLYEKLTAYEEEIFDISPIVPNIIEERDGYYFSSDFHVIATSWYLENSDMASAVSSAEKVILTNPFDISLYTYAAQVALTAGDYNAAVGFINNGLLLDENNGDINLFAAILAYGKADNDLAVEYLEKAVKNGVSDMYSDVLAGTRNAVKGGA